MPEQTYEGRAPMPEHMTYEVRARRKGRWLMAYRAFLIPGMSSHWDGFDQLAEGTYDETVKRGRRIESRRRFRVRFENRLVRVVEYDR